MDNYLIHSSSAHDKYPASSSSTFSSISISTTTDASSSSISHIYTTTSKSTNILSLFPSSLLVLDSTNTKDSSSSSSSISMLTNTNVPPLSTSPSTILNSSRFSSSSSSSTYTSDKIRFLLKNEKQRYEVISNKAKSAKAQHWSNFGFPAKLNEKNCGTSHLKEHSCTSNLIQTSTTSVMKQPTVEQCLTVQKNLTTDQSTVIKDLITRWVCTDIRPFSIIEDGGLRLLIQECVKLGSLYGNIDVDNILRGRTTISNHIYKLADASRQQIKLILQEPFESGCLSISPDFWNDKYRQISYLGVTATFFDSNYHYHTIDLLCRPFEGPDKSSTNVLTVHRLNKEIQAASGNVIRQATNVRWLSLIYLLDSIRTSYMEIKVILSRRKNQSRLTIISQILLEDIIRFLTPFKSVLKLIQAGSKPTLYLVLTCTLTIHKVLNSFDDLLDHVKKYPSDEKTKNKLHNYVDDDNCFSCEEDEDN
ncbi:unnamed protein product [Rotaria sp. Silwood2]|nr:unnamed protein product [Rotaria sp. Silwood2]CAF3117768.1 unnamed protein product [Rotaria sp. Silwood2]CAF3369756.1 unnamed protein product [Rotaria sp. Silwood2]CAF4336255.1 unnamed protein product [Rotaria sp. Silwood2]CAF4366478.1 unnamed protein product [Rotaria sp. Silwood2]